MFRQLYQKPIKFTNMLYLNMLLGCEGRARVQERRSGKVLDVRGAGGGWYICKQFSGPK